MNDERTARWKVSCGTKAPHCTACGMWAPFARYSRKTGVNARELTDYCPHCGAKMTGMDECSECPFSQHGEWCDNGICFTCRGDVWIYGKQHNKRTLILCKVEYEQNIKPKEEKEQ